MLKKLFILALALSSQNLNAAAKLQNEDFKSATQLNNAGSDMSHLLNTTKIYDVQNSQQLSTSISSGVLGGNGATKLVAQTSHGFTVGQPVYFNGTAYALANASTDATSEALGIVSAVVDANDFKLTGLGYITGLSGLTAGSTYYLGTTAGTLSATQPSTAGQVSKPMFVADSATSGYVIQSRGVVVSSSGPNSQLLYYGEFNGGSTSYFSISSATLAVPSQFGTPFITQYKNNNMGTVTIASVASATAPGISFTPVASCKNALIEICGQMGVSSNSGVPNFQVYENNSSTVLGTVGAYYSTANQYQICPKGYMDLVAGTAYTFVMRVNSNAGTVQMGNLGTQTISIGNVRVDCR